jgi:regulatory protein
MAFSKRAKVKLDEPALFDYALKLLGGRACSSGEMREKLRARAERLSDADAAIAKLKESGYLDDKQFAEHYAARRLENEGFGRGRVLSDLRTRRVAPAIAEVAVKSAFAETDEVQLVEQFLARKYRRTPLAEVLADPKGMAAAYRKLRTAGFSHVSSMGVLKRHAKDLEALDSLDAAGDVEPQSE